MISEKFEAAGNFISESAVGNIATQVAGAGFEFIGGGLKTVGAAYGFTFGRASAYISTKLLGIFGYADKGDKLEEADGRPKPVVRLAHEASQLLRDSADKIRTAIFNIPRIIAPKIPANVNIFEEREGLVAEQVNKAYKVAQIALQDEINTYAAFDPSQAAFLESFGDRVLTVMWCVGMVEARIVDTALAVIGLAATILTSPLTYVKHDTVQSNLRSLHNFTFRSLSFTRVLCDVPTAMLRFIDTEVQLNADEQAV